MPVMIAAPDPRPPSSQFANTEPITTYVIWVNSWYGDRINPYARTPLFPGDDASGKCIFRCQGIVMTSNSSGCLVFTGLGDNPPPAGWRRGTWIKNDLWFPNRRGMRHKIITNGTLGLRQTKPTVTTPMMCTPQSCIDNIESSLSNCTWNNGTKSDMSIGFGSGAVPDRSNHILLIYAGLGIFSDNPLRTLPYEKSWYGYALCNQWLWQMVDDGPMTLCTMVYVEAAPDGLSWRLPAMGTVTPSHTLGDQIASSKDQTRYEELIKTSQVPIGTSTIEIETDPDSGSPAATVTLFPVFPDLPGASPSHFVFTKPASYFVVYFTPILLSVLILLPVQAIDVEITMLLPFRLLTKAGNGSVHALPMRTGGFAGRWNGFRLLLLKHGDPMSLVGDVMVICAAGLVTVSGETIGLKLRGTCIKQNLNTGCFVTIALFPGPARAAQALLGVLMVLIVLLGIMLSRWKTGTATHPTSVASVCTLMQVRGVRSLVQSVYLRKMIALDEMDENNKRKRLGDRRVYEERLSKIKFKLCRVESGRRAEDYGLVGSVADNEKPASDIQQSRDSVTSVPRVSVRTLTDGRVTSPQKMDFSVPSSERVAQGIYLFFMCSLLALVLYYENTESEDRDATPFESFMDSQSFGRDVYRRMAQRPQPAALSVLQPRATNVFTGVWRSIRQRDPLAGTMAFAGILSKFLPLLLSGVPFAVAQTWLTHEICTWTAIAFLIPMVLVLISHSWLVKWPEMPAAPADSLACCVQYKQPQQQHESEQRHSQQPTQRPGSCALKYSKGAPGCYISDPAMNPGRD
ncbi:hypothetical protein QBC35DRAFT_473851 [Podospora australis]|uniref:Uncharacterized protein n=1 Tax=Podospora australis TaxID=1536484 RepID=A0AAN6WVJ6_9PEZI|nr:hypothetical protein QBC35DRAFT_473851 [Podospora australis]